MSDNTIDPKFTPPNSHRPDTDKDKSPNAPAAKKYVSSSPDQSTPSETPVTSRAVNSSLPTDINKEKLDRLVSLIKDNSYAGFAAGLKNYVKTLAQFSHLDSKLPENLSIETMTILADHAGSLIAEDILARLNNTNISLPEQLDEMGEYMVKIGAPENVVKMIAASRSNDLLENTPLNPELKVSLREDIEKKVLSDLTQRMTIICKTLLAEGSLTEEQKQKMEVQARQIGIELSGYIG